MRRGIVLDRLRIHPCTIEYLMDLFPSYDRAKQYMANLVKRELTMIVGTVPWHEDCRPRNVYSCRDIARQNVKHELTGTMIFRNYQAEFKRGGKLPFDCDAVMNTDKTYFWEIDLATETHTQVEQKWEKYRDCRDFVLFATTSEERKAEILKRAGNVSSVLLVSKIQDLVMDPFGRVWTDVRGKTAALSVGHSIGPSKPR